MSIKKFGVHKTANQKTAETYIAELQKLVGVNFPISVTVDNDGNLIGASYEAEWKEGGTEPVEHVNKKTKEITITYKENYKNLKLSAADIKKVDDYIAGTLKKA